MNNLSNGDIDSLLEDLDEWKGFYTDPADREQHTMFSKAIAAISELLALREAGKEPVALTEKHEISNMQSTGLYLRAWPADRKRNAIEGYTVALYAASQLPAVPDGWVMVPIEPTAEMIQEGMECASAAVYRRMIAAAPKPDPSVKK